MGLGLQVQDFGCVRFRVSGLTVQGTSDRTPGKKMQGLNNEQDER